ncbi:MAG TPA: (2Fe-2S)-binding protein [Abditibacteriaceae bacterium]|nr:(2Fe-2S)-binding protein [Abditibacteriaceae bacterium]
MLKTLELNVNGTIHRVNVETQRSLLSVLRDELDLIGTKYGCGEAECGACTVLLGGQRTRSCVTPVNSTVGKTITTIEGLEKDGQLHPLQQAFLDEGAMQCGYCTSGMIMAGVALLNRNPNPTQQEIVRFMEGNICRCCAYPRIVAAIRRAAEMKGGSR